MTLHEIIRNLRKTRFKSAYDATAELPWSENHQYDLERWKLPTFEELKIMAVVFRAPELLRLAVDEYRRMIES